MHSFTYQDRGLWFKQKVSLPEVPPPSLPSAGQPGSRRCWEGWIQVPSQTLRLKWDIYKKRSLSAKISLESCKGCRPCRPLCTSAVAFKVRGFLSIFYSHLYL